MPFAAVMLTMAAISAAATIGQGVTQVSQASSDKERLKIQEEQMRLETQQRTLSNYDALKKVLAAQIAENSVSGTAPTSASFNAIQRATVNAGARQQKNIELEQDLSEENYDIEKESINKSLYGKLFADAANLGFTGFDIYSKMPRKSSSLGGGKLF